MELSRHVTTVQIRYIIMQRDGFITFPKQEELPGNSRLAKSKAGYKLYPTTFIFSQLGKYIISHGHV